MRANGSRQAARRPGSPTRRLFIVLPTLLALSCSLGGRNGANCALDGGEEAVRSELYFGLLRRSGAVVSTEEWQRFVDEVVAPRLPDGFTVVESYGQYLPAGGGSPIREPSRVLTVVYAGNGDKHRRLIEIVELYKQRFDQEAVFSIEQPVCARMR